MPTVKAISAEWDWFGRSLCASNSSKRPRVVASISSGVMLWPRLLGSAYSMICSQRCSWRRPSTVTAWLSESMRWRAPTAGVFTKRNRFKASDTSRLMARSISMLSASEVTRVISSMTASCDGDSFLPVMMAGLAK